MKPRLPAEIEARLPLDVLRHLYRFVPHLPKKRPAARPGLQQALTRLQTSPKLTAMALYGLDDFVLC